MSEANIKYLIVRLYSVIELIAIGDKHMAVAKILADISALRAMLPKQTPTEETK